MSEKDDKKKKKKDQKNGNREKEQVKLLEGTALKNRDSKKGKEKTAIWVKDWHLRYEIELKKMQIELMKLQTHMKSTGERILAIFEGRDAAGKGGTIKRFVEHLNPRHARVVALTKPNETEGTQWYFQRYVSHLPSAGEIVFFDRSWYNRAVVEPVNGFCSKAQYEIFMSQVNEFEKMLIQSDTYLIKFYFSITKKEQKKRFDEIKSDPLKRWKMTAVDERAQELWDDYTKYKKKMFAATNTKVSPWVIINANKKPEARLEAISHILRVIPYE